MKKICIITGTRADYGLLFPLISLLASDRDFDMRLVVTGSHLSPQFGLTYQQIEKDGFDIDKKIDILMSSDTPSAVSKAMALAMIGFGDYFECARPDLVIVLGDRYEILAAVSAAVVAGVPVAHLHGGEVTEGAYDELFRHAITKMSLLHFTSSELHRQRVIQLGEQPDRVFNVGAIGIDNIVNARLMDKQELASSVQFSLEQPYALVTFHPVTMEKTETVHQFQQLLDAMDLLEDMRFIITKANADDGGRLINQMIDQYVALTPHKAIAVASLGQIRYLSAMKYCTCVIGNSSSGIIEAPSFQVPTIDIGNRQKGRTAADSVIHCEPDTKAIMDAVRTARSKAFQDSLPNIVNPYGDGHVSAKIVGKLKIFFLRSDDGIKKSFYDYN